MRLGPSLRLQLTRHGRNEAEQRISVSHRTINRWKMGEPSRKVNGPWKYADPAGDTRNSPSTSSWLRNEEPRRLYASQRTRLANMEKPGPEILHEAEPFTQVWNRGIEPIRNGKKSSVQRPEHPHRARPSTDQEVDSTDARLQKCSIGSLEVSGNWRRGHAQERIEETSQGRKENSFGKFLCPRSLANQITANLSTTITNLQHNGYWRLFPGQFYLKQ